MVAIGIGQCFQLRAYYCQSLGNAESTSAELQHWANTASKSNLNTPVAPPLPYWVAVRVPAKRDACQAEDFKNGVEIGNGAILSILAPTLGPSN